MTIVPLLAHAGPGATWQALLVVIALGLAVVFVLALVGKVSLERPDDLVLPLAGVAIASSLAPLGAEVLSDWIGWAFPMGVVLLITVVLVATTPLELSVTQPIAYGAVAIATIGALALHQPLTIAWHPPVDMLPVADDVEIAIVSLDDGAEVEAGAVPVTVAVDGGSIGDELIPVDQVRLDAEEGGLVAVALDGEVLQPALAETCSFEVPCASVSFEIDVDPGEHTLSVEFRRADGASFTPLVTDRVTFTAG